MTSRTICGAAGFALLLALSPTQSDAQATARPFAPMAGNWSGEGTVIMSNGGQERMRCRANYAVGQGGEQLQLDIRCASDSFNFELASNVANQGGKISGEWSEATRNAGGTVAGRTNGRQIQAFASGANFSANLSLTTEGNRQSIAIQPQGTDVERVLR